MSKAQMTETVSDDKFPSDLQEDLEELDYYHNAGTVEVEVRKVDRVGDDDVVVVFKPPVGDRFRRRWQIPQSPDERTGFGLLLHACGHNLGTAENVIGERVPFAREDGEWEMAAEWPPDPFFARLSKRGEPAVNSAWVVGAFLFTPVTLAHLVLTDEDDKVSPGERLAIWMLGTVVWAVVIGVISVVLLAGLQGMGVL